MRHFLTLSTLSPPSGAASRALAGSSESAGWRLAADFKFSLSAIQACGTLVSVATAHASELLRQSPRRSRLRSDPSMP